MRKTCAGCGTEFEAKRDSAKTCSATCRKRIQRQPSNIVGLPTNPAPDEEGSLTAATRRSLVKAGRIDTDLGAAALLLAIRLDNAKRDTGMSVAALMKEYRTTLAEATKDSEEKDGTVDEIRDAALRLINGLGA
jgi:hypothetical protein